MNVVTTGGNRGQPKSVESALVEIGIYVCFNWALYHMCILLFSTCSLGILCFCNLKSVLSIDRNMFLTFQRCLEVGCFLVICYFAACH